MRMTVSLCVIMVEITNNLKLLPLIMLVLLTSKVFMHSELFLPLVNQDPLNMHTEKDMSTGCPTVLVMSVYEFDVPSNIGDKFNTENGTRACRKPVKNFK